MKNLMKHGTLLVMMMTVSFFVILFETEVDVLAALRLAGVIGAIKAGVVGLHGAAWRLWE